MADVLNAVRSYLLGVSSITDIIGQRFYVDRRMQSATHPCATITRVSETHDHLISNRSGFVQTRLQIECFSTLRSTTQSLAEVIYRSGIAAVKGATGGVNIRGVTVEDGRRDYTIDDSTGGDDHVYVTQFDLLISYKEG